MYCEAGRIGRGRTPLGRVALGWVGFAGTVQRLSLVVGPVQGATWVCHVLVFSLF